MPRSDRRRPQPPTTRDRGGNRLLVEDYAERVKGCAQYLTRLLADQGTRVDNPVDEPIGPEESAPLELGDDRGIVRFGVDPSPGITAAAIDGGSACLVNGRSFWVIAYRAGTIWHRDRVTVHEDAEPLTIEALTQTDAKGRYAQALRAAGVIRERELADLGGVVDVLRELAEWRRVREAIERAVPGDLVLVDGSLHPGAFLPASLVVPIHELALRRCVDLVGVTKASKLRWGRYAPLVLRVRRRAEVEVGPDARWYLRVTRDPDELPPAADPETGEAAPPWRSEVYVARLASCGAYAFRVDAVRGRREPDELFAVLAGLSDDPAFLGYPYPLARVHQVVSLPGHLLADLRRDLRAAFLREGLPEDDVDLVMRDFHLTLNA
ncbi:MAG TPA: DNA double-strand break repair nuclease NurA [Actinomycetota bacterium]|nr:DNA double-strand break repair nuclease NurA [Actinomycetota bacterium]